MVDQSPSFWQLFYVAEVTAGTTPSSAAYTFLGITTSGPPTPNPTYNSVRGSGSQDFYVVNRSRRDPMANVTLHLPVVLPLVDLVNTDQYFTLLFRDSTNTQYVRLVGAKIDRVRVSCDVNEEVVCDLDIKAFDTLLTISGGSPTYSGNSPTTALQAQNVTVSKAGSTLTDWTRVSFECNFNLVPLYTPSTGVIRSLGRHARDHTFTVARAMDTATAFDEYSDVANDTARTMKLLLTNVSGGLQWSVTATSAKTTGIDADLLRPADVIGKEITYQAPTITFATS